MTSREQLLLLLEQRRNINGRFTNIRRIGADGGRGCFLGARIRG